METVNIHEAKTQLSKLLDGVSKGKPFIIAKAGKPIARVVSIDAPEAGQARRLGFLTGQVQVPDDFDRMGEEEILAQFGVDDAPAA
ncbi:antitoxin of a toxin/antitoxin system, phd-like protein [Thioalkalivibrio sulfidiphilus HL-EbGr7]|uniref:Antitoxin n=1 Tax=Thioalkalivibrio sulfidiphilus (strain HL-EbGR7) TaxID=396588 RepID=B8GV80_THISH|nr:type II toxin-antitoxin system prevent-host-death family antitoxin [Thioalkalivibrio sulfidiphilus]ACL73426.1 antitoxin of a toxin/antitoxin system, phd-like protein [Thioalkalivibrio sulfidiphilus HL-EbGr7]